MSRDACITSFQKGDHICLFYRTPVEQLSAAGPFVQVGLERGERCLCVLPQSELEGLLAWLSNAGVDVDERIANGALVLAKPEEAYLAGGSFNRELMLKFLDAGMREALRLHFTGFRGTGDLSWAARDSGACSQMPEYEAMLDRYYPGKHCLGICMYDTALFSPAQLASIQQSHRLALAESPENKRRLRIRNGQAFGDVTFDRQMPRLFHYTVQKNDSNEFFHVGQAATLPAAINCVNSALSSLAATQ
ncbi:MAG TPA: MEDS domain-containing protein [Terriglobales bacterium]|nr:MEDS domain-containing protein [Terriglobales bacterium]